MVGFVQTVVNALPLCGSRWYGLEHAVKIPVQPNERIYR